MSITWNDRAWDCRQLGAAPRSISKSAIRPATHPRAWVERLLRSLGRELDALRVEGMDRAFVATVKGMNYAPPHHRHAGPRGIGALRNRRPSGSLPRNLDRGRAAD